MSHQHHKHRLTVEDLHSIFHVDFEKGLLFWKPRSRDVFKTGRSYTTWNKRFSEKQAFTANMSKGYKHGGIFGQPYLAHRVILAMKLGYWPDFVDHINGDRSDNRVSNLRSVTYTENRCNSKIPSSNTSGHVGVSWNNRDKKWTAYICLNKKRKALGNFVNIEDAIECRKVEQTLLGFHQNHGRS